MLRPPAYTPTWQQMTGGRNAGKQPIGAAPQPAATAATKPAPAPAPASAPLQDKNPVTFTAAPRGSTPEDAKAWAKELIAKDMQANAERQKRIKAKKASVKIPAWQEGTILGGWNKKAQQYAANYTR